jgi:superfamily I DNA/RNA helicase
MDLNELSRQTGARLHDEAVKRGIDPRDPYAFAKAEALRRDIDVERVSAGDVRLHGSRALYDPGAQLILHEQSKDVFTDAFLVAHEIGHVAFGGAKDFASTTNADPERSAEASPVGVDRVVDYNAKQRREVQMDLFARELLLPRGWLRSLHLDQNRSASEIATDVNAPFSVVAQQLFDALFLPEVAIKESFQKTSPPPNADQKKAIEHTGSPYLLEAGPGTGKTQTLVGRVNHLLASGVPPAKILVLTFSNKAAGELTERISQQYPEAANGMWIGTFHAFGLDIVRRFHDHLSLSAEPRLLDRTDAIGLLESEYPRLQLTHLRDIWNPSRPLRLALDAISRANDEVTTPAEYRALAEAMLSQAASDEEKVAAEKSLEVAKVFEVYEKLKRENDSVDFGDLVSMPIRLCESNAEALEALSSLYDHVLVDEFQDVNRASVKLLKILTNDGENLWAVGDAKQSIYRFRGASSFNTRRFGNEDFPVADRGRLSVNYRSVSEVCDAFVQFASSMSVAAGNDVSLDAHRGSSGNAPECRKVGTQEHEVVALKEGIDELLAAGHSYSDQAVLCTGNDRLGKLAKGLESLGVPVLYLGSLFERSEIKDLLSILSLLVDRRAMGIVRLATLPGYEIPLADVALILGRLKEDDFEPLAWLNDASLKALVSDSAKERLADIQKLLSGFDATATPWTTLATLLLDRTRIAAALSESSDVPDRTKCIAIWQFMNFVRTQPSGPGYPIVRLIERVRALLLNSDERDLRQLPAAAQGIDAVRLMTIHGSKGLEFEAVHIPGLNKTAIPRSARQSMANSIIPPDGMIEGAAGTSRQAIEDGVEDEYECLFFVALSRARDRLFLYYPSLNDTGNARPKTPYLERLTGKLSNRDLSAKGAGITPSGVPAVPLTIEGTSSFTDRQLALYDKCPRRFFYTHILQVGGRRTESAFMQLHSAVQQVLDSFSDQTGESLTLAQVEEQLEIAWQSKGPIDHGYNEDYRRIATQLVRYYVQSMNGLTRGPIPELRYPVPGGEVIVTPDQVLTAADGSVSMRRIRTGHKSSSDADNLASAAFHLAARAHKPGCRVELVHLSDGAVSAVDMSDRKLQNRQQSISAAFSAVKAGEFPPSPNNPSLTCPSCPALFVCGAVPAGPLEIKAPD